MNESEARRSLGFRPPFATAELMRFLEARAVPGIEEVDGPVFRRSLRTRDGLPVVLSVTTSANPGSSLVVEVKVDGQPEIEPVAQAVRRLFDLDADAAAIDAALAADPVLAPSVRAAPGLRLPGAADPFETAVRIVLGQQVSVPGARTFCSRIVAAFGEPLDRPAGAVTHLFPRAEVLADAPVERVGLPWARAETVRRLAGAVAEGTVDLSGAADPGTTLEALGDVPGVGPWTRSMVAMRVLHDPDAFCETDLGVKRGAAALGLPTAPGPLLARADAWRPWRGYAVMRLWHAAAGRGRPAG